MPEVDTPATKGTNGKGLPAINPSQRWRAMEKILARESPFGAETGLLPTGEFDPFENVSCDGVELRYSMYFFSPRHWNMTRRTALRERHESRRKI